MAAFDASRPDGGLSIWGRGQLDTRFPNPDPGSGRPVPFTAGDPLAAECEHFLDCCLNRIPPRTDGHEALAVLRVLAAAEQSLHADGRVVGIAGLAARGRGLPLSGRLVADAVADDVASRVRAVATPRAAVWATQQLAPTTKTAAGTRPAAVHTSSTIDATADVGPGTAVARDVHVGRCASIGPANVLCSGASIAEHVRTGAGCRIERNAIICSGVTLEDGVVCGPGSVFADPPGAAPDGNQLTLVRQGAVIGANATIERGRRLGRHSRVAAAAVVTVDVPDYALVGGVPARPLGWVCACGTALRFEGGAAGCDRCGAEYDWAGGVVRPRAGKGKDDFTVEMF